MVILSLEKCSGSEKPSYCHTRKILALAIVQCTYIHKMAMNRKTHTQTIQEMSQVPGLSYNLIP